MELEETALHAPGDPRERDSFIRVAHFLSHGVHWALFASLDIREAKRCSFGLKPGGGFVAELDKLLPSALNSGTNPVLCSLDMLDAFRDGEGEVVEPRIESADE
jgi:hypothetical protein